jgi:hypothetical protein
MSGFKRVYELNELLPNVTDITLIPVKICRINGCNNAIFISSSSDLELSSSNQDKYTLVYGVGNSRKNYKVFASYTDIACKHESDKKTGI